MQATVRVQHQTLIFLLVFLPSFFLFLPYLATNKTKDEARRRRRKVRNHVQLDGYHSSLITPFGACPFDPFFLVRSHHWHHGSVGPWPPSSHERMLLVGWEPYSPDSYNHSFLSWAYPHGYQRSQIALYAFCPFGFIAIIGTAAQWSLGHQAATNACSQAFPHHL